MDAVAELISLIGSALRGVKAGVSEDLTHDDWKTLLGICAAQGIHTFVFDALPDSVPEDIRVIWRSQVDGNSREGARLNAVAQAQENGWIRRGFKYALLKGPAVAQLYPAPERRGVGDLDWWFGDETSWEGALEMARRNADSGIEVDSDRDVNYSFKEVTVEHHRDWTHLASRRLRRIAGSPALVDGRLGPEDTILSEACHILHHLPWKGLNIKQIVDMAVVFEAYFGKYDPEAFRGRLDALGLSGWMSALEGLVLKVTGMNAESLPVRPTDRFTDDLLMVILSSRSHLLLRFGLFWKLARRECVARYLYLVCGKILKY